MRVTGIVDEEELGGASHTLRRQSSARASAESVATVLRRLGYLNKETDVHIHFPGGAPVDGPSAGAAMAVAAVSALIGRPVDGGCAITGELSVQGQIRPVGGVPEKVEAACLAGLNRVFVPRENLMEQLEGRGAEILPLDDITQAIDRLLLPPRLLEKPAESLPLPAAALTARGAEP